MDQEKGTVKSDMPGWAHMGPSLHRPFSDILLKKEGNRAGLDRIVAIGGAIGMSVQEGKSEQDWNKITFSEVFL